MNNELKQFKKRKKKEKKMTCMLFFNWRQSPILAAAAAAWSSFNDNVVIQRERGREVDGAINRELDSGGKGSSMAAANGEERENVKVSSKKMNRVY